MRGYTCALLSWALPAAGCQRPVRVPRQLTLLAADMSKVLRAESCPVVQANPTAETEAVENEATPELEPWPVPAVPAVSDSIAATEPADETEELVAPAEPGTPAPEPEAPVIATDSLAGGLT